MCQKVHVAVVVVVAADYCSVAAVAVIGPSSTTQIIFQVVRG